MLLELVLGIVAVAAAAALGGFWGRRTAARQTERELERLAADVDRVRIEHLGHLPASAHEETGSKAMQAVRVAADGLIAELDQQRRRLGGAVDNLQEGLLVLDGQRRVQFANSAAALAVGVPIAPSAELAEITRQPEILDALRRATPEAGWVVGDVYEAPDGRLMQPSAGSVGDGRTAVLLRDVTLEKQVETMRREFVANVSHELKTPLTAIRGYAETLDSSLEDPTLGRFVERILAQCRRLEELLADVMELARLEGDEVMLRTERVAINLRELFDDVVERVREEHPDSQTAIAVEAPEGTVYRGYRDFLSQLFRNLVDNAVKYSPDGSSVTVRVVDHGNAVDVIVSDDGPGIASEHLPHLFERFYRVDTGRDRSSGGTGLGLAIVKHAARAHGGSVMVQSRLGFGTSFTVHLPR